ncbi:hypothetical protein M0804_003433 [Polistes exclamans]|nr:hypothetical protein M0804_003433 [Polistes exclamans]
MVFEVLRDTLPLVTTTTKLPPFVGGGDGGHDGSSGSGSGIVIRWGLQRTLENEFQAVVSSHAYITTYLIKHYHISDKHLNNYDDDDDDDKLKRMFN